MKLNSFSCMLIIGCFFFSSCEEDEMLAVDPNDSIAKLLSTSLENYINASNDEWVMITEQEYQNLSIGISNISIVGTSDQNYDTTSDIITTSSSPSTLTNETTTAIMPRKSYLFAFKYHAVSAVNQPGCKIKLSDTSNTEGYSDIGNNLPIHSAYNKDVFFVLKGNNTPTTDLGYLAFFKPAGLTIGRKTSTNNNTYFFELGDTNEVTEQTSTPLKVLYQGLSTTNKQW
ncbi:hypothetical protein [Aquimarina litoralis]|uniref:hypothetical protein n=1 Tax=Aquimarina litoralis TaxID=584605 RepID=UPI001C59BF10|nr:hypothetical protein [Aquimarina litoralis]MBW1294019.1 hypothetical protein [Aquimarina litoralis]